MVVKDYLTSSGAIVGENPDWVIENDWLAELRREFVKETDNTEEEEYSDIPESLVIDPLSKQKLDEERQVDEERANIILKNKSLDVSKIDVDPKQFTLDIIIRRLENEEILLDPDFQRRADLWDATRQSKLIESILIKLPLPAFYFDGSNDSKWAVVDGLQRLSAIKNFVVTKTLKLEGLEFLGNLEGKGYNDLPRPLHRRIQETVIFAFLIKPGTPDTLKFNIFKRINTGGLVLSPQEIRHALNQGIPAKLLAELAELTIFKEATGYSLARNQRMIDRDYINRFVAFYLQGYDNYERGVEGLDGFLNIGMSQINETNKDEIKKKFEQALNTAKEIFGHDAFRKRFEFPAEKRRKPLNKALFESWMVNLAKLSASDCQNLIEKKEIVLQKSAELFTTDSYFDVSITYGTGDQSRVRYRFGTINKLIHEVLAT